MEVNPWNSVKSGKLFEMEDIMIWKNIAFTAISIIILSLLSCNTTGRRSVKEEGNLDGDIHEAMQRIERGPTQLKQLGLTKNSGCD